MIEVRVEGADSIRDELGRLAVRVEEGFVEERAEALELALERAREVSPVVTGSYRAAHIIAVEANRAEMKIDPSARNGNVMVIDYAGPVEARHGVYEQASGELPRVATVAEELIWGELGLGN